MATFSIQAPDGKAYTIEGDNAEGALAALKKYIGGASGDKYQQAAQADIAAVKAAGGDEGAGLTQRLVHGATLGADSTLLAAAQTPFEMIRHGTFNPVEGYKYAKAREDQIMSDARQNTGILGAGAEALGGAISGAGLANAGITAGRLLAPNAGLLARSAAAAADAAGLGGVSGAMEGNGIRERFNNAVKGAAAGGLIGGLTPGAMALGGAALSPVISNIKARVNPEGFAQGQVARAIHESGLSPDDLATGVQQAAQEGQPQFNLADAMGNPGQRMLSTVARAPGEGRTAVVDALDNRQAGQGRRIANTLSEGFGSRMTPTELRSAMEASRGNVADAEYGTVRNGAGRVDVVPTINNLDSNIGTAPGQTLQAPNDSIESILRPFRERLARVNPDDFEAVQRIRGDMADAAQSARQGGYGNRARLIGQAVHQLDASMENASQGFRQANANFRQASQDINAIDAGRTAALRGRTEDTIPTFQGQSLRGQQAFRTGYVDPLIEAAQGGAPGVNKARPLLNDAFQQEAAAMAPGNPLMQRRIGREQTMFETRNQALGGSRTADNLNDHAAMGVDPHLVGQIVTGNWHGALRSALSAGHSALTGNTPEVRREVANILLQNGGNISAPRLRDMVNNTVARIQFVQNIARNVGRGAAGGLAIAAPSVTQPVQ